MVFPFQHRGTSSLGCHTANYISMINGKIAVCLCACFLWKTVAFAQSTSNSYNIKVPARAGVLPNISTQGKNDKFTTSNFSLNLLGGYTGSVNGLELGGW